MDACVCERTQSVPQRPACTSCATVPRGGLAVLQRPYAQRLASLALPRSWVSRLALSRSLPSVSFLVEGRSPVGPRPTIVLSPLRRSSGRGSADGSETQGAVERGTQSVSASIAGRKEERDRDRSSEGEAVVCRLLLESTRRSRHSR